MDGAGTVAAEGKGESSHGAFDGEPEPFMEPHGVRIVSEDDQVEPGQIGSILRSTHLVDLFDASLDGYTLVVSYPIETIKAAPNYHASIGQTLRDDHATHVLSHYRGAPQPV